LTFNILKKIVDKILSASCEEEDGEGLLLGGTYQVETTTFMKTCANHDKHII
jgi:hypothetical protein